MHYLKEKMQIFSNIKQTSVSYCMNYIINNRIMYEYYQSLSDALVKEQTQKISCFSLVILIPPKSN